ncbi:hypothetical protein EIP91_011464 [Steccherinum ochraceum]|uniref:F-box domain-containing protein n=1 Tax=Steccherinum ochraceum TaxID=92696 RepID=A0A4V2MUT7_9APHY|nr:hypothetical protein EIP91_011464 [Steccherinum ochraceum]
MSWSWDLTDDTMAKIANEWPDIESLELDPSGFWPTPSNVTTHGLHTLASSCRKLHMLGIQFNSTPPDFSQTEELYSHLGGRTGSSEMKILGVGRSVIDRPAEVAVMLSSLFPTLAGCLPDLAMNQVQNRERWMQVSELLSRMGLARRQERWWEEHSKKSAE